MNLTRYKVSSLYYLSDCYLAQGKYAEAEKTALQALATADTAGNTFTPRLYEIIAQANIQTGNKTKAAEYFKKTTNAIRNYSNESFQSSLSNMEVKYQTEKKESKIADLEKEKRFMTGLGIAGGIVLLLVSVTSILLWRLTVRKKQMAEQQVNQLEQEKKLTATQSVLDGETYDRTRLARDLQDGLGSMLTTAKLNLAEMKKENETPDNAFDEYFNKTANALTESIHEIRRMVHHLMPHSLARYGLKTAVKDFCKSIENSDVSFDYFGEEKRIDPLLETVVYRSIHELVNNALKHAGASEIWVQIMQEPDRIAFSVHDNGCGFDTSAETKGAGLQNIKNLITSFGGKIEIDSKKGEGTEVTGELINNEQ
jgi:signal transduction histidine kinase